MRKIVKGFLELAELMQAHVVGVLIANELLLILMRQDGTLVYC